MIRAIDQLPSLEAALQAALAGENACVYAYGVIGAHVEAAARVATGLRLDQHAVARDRLRREITVLGSTPAAGAAAYDLPMEVTDSKGARALGALVEDRMALVWADVVASARAAGSDAITALAADQVAACAVSAAKWSGHTEAFPGLASQPSTSPSASPSG